MTSCEATKTVSLKASQSNPLIITGKLHAQVKVSLKNEAVLFEL